MIRRQKTIAGILVTTPFALALALAASCSAPHDQEGRSGVVRSPLEPTLSPGDPTCADLGFSSSIDDSPVDIGTFVSGDVSVTVSNLTSVFDFTATAGIAVVIVKGGPDANVYRYDPPTMADVGLHPPVNVEQGEGKFYGFKRIQFCFNDTPMDAGTDAGVSAEGGADAGTNEDGGQKTW